MNAYKERIVEELVAKLNQVPYVLLVDYQGMTVSQFSEFRTRLKACNAECHVAKNSYINKALEKLELPSLKDSLVGQIAFISGENEVSAAAKVTLVFAKEFKHPQLKVGIVDGEVLDQSQLTAIADLPPKEILLAKTIIRN